MTPLPALGQPVPTCTACFGNDPLVQYVYHLCASCLGHPAEDLSHPERARIAATPLPTDDDITAFHLYGMPDRNPREARWLSSYEASRAFAAAEAEQREADRPPKPEVRGVHIGAVGDRVTLVVKVEAVRELTPGDFGRRFLVVMTDLATGAKVKWFTGEGLRLKEGESYTTRATVKEHGDWNGEAETIVSRVKEEEGTPS